MGVVFLYGVTYGVVETALHPICLQFVRTSCEEKHQEDLHYRRESNPLQVHFKPSHVTFWNRSGMHFDWNLQPADPVVFYLVQYGISFGSFAEVTADIGPFALVLGPLTTYRSYISWTSSRRLRDTRPSKISPRLCKKSY